MQHRRQLGTTADLMGHANTRMTMEVYQHITDTRKRKAADQIGRRLFEKL